MESCRKCQSSSTVPCRLSAHDIVRNDSATSLEGRVPEPGYAVSARARPLRSSRHARRRRRRPNASGPRASPAVRFNTMYNAETMWLTQDRLFSRACSRTSSTILPLLAVSSASSKTLGSAGASPGRGCYEFSHASAAAASSQRSRRMHLWRRRVAKEETVCGDEGLGSGR